MTKFQHSLDKLKNQNRYRSLNKASGVDLTSNDYLGMRSHPALKQAALEAINNGLELGAGGSRLLRGHSDVFEELENYAAKHFGSERALYFANGFIANYALFTTLPDRHDTILFDSLIHASARDGISASNARSIKVEHNDLNAYEIALQKVTKSNQGSNKERHIWVAIESVYSMDGDKAPITELQNLCRKYGATLIVDEAHATGIYGKTGAGLTEGLPQDNLIVLHTCGKAVGVAGGIICASTEIIDYLINAARPFIYSTAPMPLQAHLTQKSLEILSSEDGHKRRQDLAYLLGFMRSDHILNGAFKTAQSQIIPIILGEDDIAVETAKALQDSGYDIRAIRPPTVPEGTARLRLSLSTNLDEATLLKFSQLLSPLLNKPAA